MSKKVSTIRPKTGLQSNLDNSKLDNSSSSRTSGVGKFTQNLKGVASKNLTNEGRKLTNKHTLSGQSFNDSATDNNLIPKTLSDNKVPHVMETMESKIGHLIDECHEMLTNKEYFENKASSGEQYELVEKEVLKKFEQDNEELKILKNTHGEKYNELVGKHTISVNELKKLKAKFKSEEKGKEEDNNKIFEIEQTNTEIILYNQKLRDKLAKEFKEKENIFKTITAFLKKFDTSINKDVKKLLKSFTQEMFLPLDKQKEDEEKVKDLTGKLKKLERESKNLDIEIEQIKKTLNEERMKGESGS